MCPGQFPQQHLLVMSQANMAKVRSSCLEGTMTRGGILESTPLSPVVEEDKGNLAFRHNVCYSVLIAKPLMFAAKGSHHMGIMMVRG